MTFTKTTMGPLTLTDAFGPGHAFHIIARSQAYVEVLEGSVHACRNQEGRPRLLVLAPALLSVGDRTCRLRVGLYAIYEG